MIRRFRDLFNDDEKPVIDICIWGSILAVVDFIGGMASMWVEMLRYRSMEEPAIYFLTALTILGALLAAFLMAFAVYLARFAKDRRGHGGCRDEFPT